jgi:probable rRNA maturation factor
VIIFEKPVVGLSQTALARFVTRARRAAGLRAPVNVLITSGTEMKSLNRRFRGKDAATDVLSFPSAEDDAKKFAGEVAISADIAAENARELGHSPGVEVKILALHGILHLRGYDHEHDNGQMARREQELRRQLHLPAGLIERTEITGPTRRERRRA